MHVSKASQIFGSLSCSDMNSSLVNFNKRNLVMYVKHCYLMGGMDRTFFTLYCVYVCIYIWVTRKFLVWSSLVTFRYKVSVGFGCWVICIFVIMKGATFHTLSGILSNNWDDTSGPLRQNHSHLQRFVEAWEVTLTCLFVTRKDSCPGSTCGNEVLELLLALSQVEISLL